ncbi:hypothetical protein Acor_82970 [Acrocarpospora corrugata]|uniref:Mycothiol-dependent maleylpyruvate isomerase metal-binding domain-containing protein n=1 Tax=Acrocarpospora corrugata TaxID=35763 RepID=A0A5M3WIP0_9ACTN|nr:maleylpyruvate isomerase family mycothiol-dependent enzyme [Acrocarpospora corrugata]GES06228.1 hypothetical protein Acor_82970 [Acrocarpospora corrugata]
MPDSLDPLRSSIQRLRDLVETLRPEQLIAKAYPTKWITADVLSHLGSGAVIFERRLDDALNGQPTPPEFAPSVWDEWNAKATDAQAADALAADRSALARLEAMTPDDQARCSVDFGPFTLDYPAFFGLRLNEHVLHTWDIDVVTRPDVTLASDAVAVMIDNLELIARFSAKPTGTTHTLVIHTSEPARTFTITLTPETVTTSPGGDAQQADVTLPAEAFVRLVYGRLDPGHTPPGITGAHHLDELRQVFPGP